MILVELIQVMPVYFFPEEKSLCHCDYSKKIYYPQPERHYARWYVEDGINRAWYLPPGTEKLTELTLID